MKYFLALLFIFQVFLCQGQTGHLFGIEAGYGTAGMYGGVRLNLNKLFHLNTGKFVTEIYGNYFGRQFNFNSATPGFSGDGETLVVQGMDNPGYVGLLQLTSNVEEKYFIDEKHFVSVIAGSKYVRTVMDKTIASQFNPLVGADILESYTDDVNTYYQQLGGSVTNLNECIWNFDVGIGVGEKFGKHFEAHTTVIYFPVEFSDDQSIFGKTFGTNEVLNPYYIPLHFTASVGIVYAFL